MAGSTPPAASSRHQGERHVQNRLRDREARRLRERRPPSRPALVGRAELPHGRPDLPPGQRAPARTAGDGAHQAAAARPLGHQPRTLDDLRPAEPAHQPHRLGLDLRHRPGARRTVTGRRRIPRRHLLPGLPAHHLRRRRRPAPVPAVLPPAGSPATSACRRPAASTRAASSGMRWRTPVGRPWTTRTSSSPVSSGTARRRPGLSPARGSCRTSSTRAATALCCRSCTSTGTRSPAPPSSGAPPTRTRSPTSRARAGTRSSSRG